MTDWYRQYLQQQHDTTQLAPGEAYLGGTESDAQPCGADQGGPLVRKPQGAVRVFGVLSRTPLGGCAKGGVYAGITAETKAFIDAAVQWQDPCTGVSSAGTCAGSVATRCSTSGEGKRWPGEVRLLAAQSGMRCTGHQRGGLHRQVSVRPA